MVHQQRRSFRPETLGIGQKIWLGYGATLGLAICGILIGLGIGHRLQNRAFAAAKQAQVEAELLNRLQTNLLETRLHEYLMLMALETTPADLRAESLIFTDYSREADRAWQAVNTFLEDRGLITYPLGIPLATGLNRVLATTAIALPGQAASTISPAPRADTPGINAPDSPAHDHSGADHGHNHGSAEQGHPQGQEELEPGSPVPVSTAATASPLLETGQDNNPGDGHDQSHGHSHGSGVGGDVDWSGLRATLPVTLALYESGFQRYRQRAEAIGQEWLAVRGQPAETVATVQTMVMELLNSGSAQELDALSHELEDLTEAIYVRLQRNEELLNQAVILNRRIIWASILLSIAVALVVGRYLSHSLSYPLGQVTAIAQRITAEDNFDLQAPITSRDEIGTLAVTLNGLVQRVKTLLQEQEAATQQKLIQSEKMASLGQMLAGVAHEINNPVNFIHGNLNHAQGYVQDLLELIHAYEAAVPNPPASVQTVAEEIDQAFLEEDLPRLLHSIKVGSERTCQIVMSLKNFSRLDSATTHTVDLHACLDSTLLLLHNRIKRGVEVVKQYGTIPPIQGSPGSLYQVFMNLLSNALDALQEVAPPHPTPPHPTITITITTARQGSDRVAITIADNGPGISPENQAKIFDTFFTTKPSGVGTGLGLAISYEVIVDKHHGQLRCQSIPGQGTQFMIELPLTQPDLKPAAAPANGKSKLALATH